MVDQMRRSSRSVCTNIAEGRRKRRYKAAFIAKLSDAESEVCETQVWLDFALSCGYIDDQTAAKLEEIYEKIMGQIVLMIEKADQWLIKGK
jgi:four helix bundle protein